MTYCDLLKELTFFGGITHTWNVQQQHDLLNKYMIMIMIIGFTSLEMLRKWCNLHYYLS